MIIFSVSTSQRPPQEAKALLQWRCVIRSASLSPAFQAPGRSFTALHGSRPLRSRTTIWKKSQLV